MYVKLTGVRVIECLRHLLTLLPTALGMLIAPLCTILTRELGRPLVMTFGVCMMSAGFVAASFAKQTWQLYLTQGVMVGLGMGAIFIPAIAVLPQWFLKRRSLAQGLASSGSGFGGLAFSLGTNAMIEQISLAWALRIVRCLEACSLLI
jgi:MFS family permease